MTEDNKPYHDLTDLVMLIKKLRSPEGCPWDQKQTKQDIGKYILDEAYEVIDSLIENNPCHIKEELGDLLFQILFITEISSEKGEFSLSDVMVTIKEKMVRRHPHVFGDVKVNSVEDVKNNWQAIKKKERVSRADQDDLFSNIPRALPELKRAQKITAIAAHHGFDWTTTAEVLNKLQEELSEFNDALSSRNQDKIEEELGDLFFTLVNLSRFVQVDSETALAKATNKFLKRFACIADYLAKIGKTPKQATFLEIDELWEKSKIDGI